MKKGRYILIIFVLVVAIGSYFIPGIIAGTLPTTSVTKMADYDYTESVSVWGVVDKKDKLEVTSSCAFIVDKVDVAVGDTIKKGQVIAVVDKDATAKKFVEAASFATMAGSGQMNLNAIYTQAYEALPDKMYSSLDGVVETVNMKVGDYIDKDTMIVSLVSSGNLIVSVPVPEKKITSIKVGQPAEISGYGFSEENNYGYVLSISPTARKAYIGTNQETIIDVTVSLENSQESVKPGCSARAKIHTSSVEKIKIIPYETIAQDDKGQEYVYVFEKGFAISKKIKTGRELADGIEVLSGISDNDIIISNPSKIKKSGTLVRVKE